MENERTISVQLKGILPGTSSSAKVREDGVVEFELFDFSPLAQSFYGNDVATIYRVTPEHKPRLMELLASQTGRMIDSDHALLKAIFATFADATSIRDWLLQNEIPYEEQFDSWA